MAAMMNGFSKTSESEQETAMVDQIEPWQIACQAFHESRHTDAIQGFDFVEEKWRMKERVSANDLT